VHLSLVTLSIILIVLVLFSAFFSASEIGMMSLNRYRLRYLVKKKNKQAIRVQAMLSKPEKLLSVVLIGNTFANIIASMAATLIGQELYGEIGVWVATILLTVVILVFSEMVPKTLAAIKPQQVAFVVSLPLSLLHTLMAPFVYLIGQITYLILRIFGVSLDKARENLTTDELRIVVNEADALLTSEHRGMLLSLLDLEQASVEDVMVPKSEIIGLDLSEPWHEVLAQLETAQHTRLPVFEDTIDQLIGMVHVRDVLNLVFHEGLDKESLIKIADEPYYVPEATSLSVQILNFQKRKERSCFVVDEYGDLIGLVTLEDILEEIVGEFTTDMAAMSKGIVQQADHSVVLDASITIRNINRSLGWQLPNIGPRTLSGMIIEHLGYIPAAQSCLRIENYQIDVLKVSDNTVKTVRVWKL
jgi:Mg2+/Co2+ transporter CorB